MANKITKREVINGLMNGTIEVTSEVAQNYLAHELELLDKKSANKKDTKKQIENQGIKATIAETLATIGRGTVSEIMKANAELGELSNQKISALLKQMVDDGNVIKTIEKKTSIFSMVEGE